MIRQLDMFPDAQALSRPPLDLSDPPVHIDTPTLVEQMAPIILEILDQKRCARLLAEEFAHASREDLLAAINEAEPELVRSGFSDLREFLQASSLYLLEQPPTLSVRFAPSLLLNLHPITTLTRSIRCRSTLTHHALEAMALGRFEELLAVIEGVHQV